MSINTYPNKTINELFGIEGQYVWPDDIDIIPEDAVLSLYPSGELHPMFGRKHSEESKEKMKSFLGKKHTEETRKKMSESAKKRRSL